jgi:hypothetical protein
MKNGDGWQSGQGGCVESFAVVESAHSFANCANEWGTRRLGGGQAEVDSFLCQILGGDGRSMTWVLSANAC